MVKSNQNGRGHRCACMLIPLAGLVVSCAWWAWLTGGAATAEEQKGADDAKAQARAAALRSATRSITTGFQASLEMKENADSLLTPALLMQEALSDDKAATVRFDAIIELNASLCRTHVALFARYWVSWQAYRVGVVWGEPHAGTLNFPIYPPTLHVASDANSFAIRHQLVHIYDSTFSKPLERRGPFKHRFNSYAFSDIRFAEQEILELRAALRDIPCAGRGDESILRKREVFLPERPLTVGFSGAGPAITIAGETRRYSELEVPCPEGGRRYVVDYQVQKMGERPLALPARITVYSGDGKRLLRAARLSAFVACPHTAEQIQEEARRFSLFDPDEVRCRELLIQYWMKNPRDIPPNDVEVLRGLQARLADCPCTSATTGERLKRVNERLELDWMLADASGLERNFRDYLSLLCANGLGRMTLFGGQNIIDTTIRWGWLAPAENLLSLWLEAARSQNDVASILEFAEANIGTGRVWTTVRLLDRTLEDSSLSAGQRFTAEAYRCIALGRICAMVKDPDHKVRTELDIAQARWVLAHHNPESLLADLTTKLDAARQTYVSLAEPTRPERALRSRLDALARSVSGPDEL